MRLQGKLKLAQVSVGFMMKHNQAFTISHSNGCSWSAEFLVEVYIYFINDQWHYCQTQDLTLRKT